MKDMAQELKEIVRTAGIHLSKINERDSGANSSELEWSKKEILGHLIDSAANNHQRIVRAVYQAADQFPTYDQDRWVEVQCYDGASWDALVGLWVAYNNHLSHIIENIPAEAESSPCNIGNGKTEPLNLVVKDYLRHLRHHLGGILDRQGIASGA